MQSKLQIGNSKETGPKSRIERVDLAQGRDRDDYTKVGPRDYIKLHQLHEKMTKASPVPTIGHTKPSYSYPKGEQPRISFLSEAADHESPLGKTSSDYGDTWMDDLPSPSALLGQEMHIETSACKATIKVPNNLVLDQDISDMEADMIGLSDSSAVKTNPTHRIGDAVLPDYEETFSSDVLNEENYDIASDIPLLSPPPELRVESREQDKAEKVVTSTCSPGESARVRMKRKATDLSDADVSMAPCAPLPKMSKRDDRGPDAQQSPCDGHQASATDSPLPSSTTLDNQAPPPTPKIKPGYPAWVYDFDPAFIAEYEDYVEFV